MVEIIEYQPKRSELGYTFGGRTPVLRIHPGGILGVACEDCFGGRIRTGTDLPSAVCDPQRLNPISGPFHIVGAEPGDTLAVHLVAIEPARDWGVSATYPAFGALTGTHQTPNLQPLLAERVWIYPIDQDTNTVRYQDTNGLHHVHLPLEPMIGTIGVAPAAGEVRSTVVPDTHGGNLDIPQVRPGTTVYLPVNVDGALLALGDAHARQGDGELCGVAVEIAAHVTLLVDLVKGMTIPGPRLESDTHLMSVGCARPLEDAYRISQADLVTWTQDLTGLDPLDAYQLVSQAGTAHIGNVCDPNYTLVAAIGKTTLPGVIAFDGLHQRLRTTAAVLG